MIKFSGKVEGDKLRISGLGVCFLNSWGANILKGTEECYCNHSEGGKRMIMIKDISKEFIREGGGL